MTAEGIGRGLEGRRCGSGWIARCPSHDDHSPSLSITERNGTVLVRCHAGCPQGDVIAALRALGLWPERERREWTQTERAEWAERQREIERHLPSARYWKRAAVLLTEEVLHGLKSALFDPMLPAPGIGEIEAIEGMLSRLRQRDGAALMDWYRDEATLRPNFTAAMVRVGRRREAAERAMVLAYLESGGEAAA